MKPIVFTAILFTAPLFCRAEAMDDPARIECGLVRDRTPFEGLRNFSIYSSAPTLSPSKVIYLLNEEVGVYNISINSFEAFPISRCP